MKSSRFYWDKIMLKTDLKSQYNEEMSTGNCCIKEMKNNVLNRQLTKPQSIR